MGSKSSTVASPGLAQSGGAIGSDHHLVAPNGDPPVSSGPSIDPGRRAPSVPARYALTDADGGEAYAVDWSVPTERSVSGEVDLATAGAVRETLQSATVTWLTLVVDLSEVRFMDSSG